MRTSKIILLGTVAAIALGVPAGGASAAADRPIVLAQADDRVAAAQAAVDQAEAALREAESSGGDVRAARRALARALQELKAAQAAAGGGGERREEAAPAEEEQPREERRERRRERQEEGEQQREERREERQERREERQEQREEPRQEQAPPPPEAAPAPPPPEAAPPAEERREERQERRRDRGEGGEERRDERPAEEAPPPAAEQPAPPPPAPAPNTGERRDRGERREERREERGERREDRREERGDRREERGERRDDRREERRDRAEDRRDGDTEIIRRDDGRVIIRTDEGVTIQHDDTQRFRRGARDVDEEVMPNGDRVTTITRPNGVQIVTITDPDGNLVRRLRVGRDGRETVLIDNRGGDDRGRWRDRDRPRRDRDRPDFRFDLDLPPVVIDIPRDEYIVDAERADEEDFEEALMAPPVEEVERDYTLDEIRSSRRLRDKVRRIDLDTITFDTGSAEVRGGEIDKLDVLGRALARAIERNPDSVFLIEGHTDAVGSDLSNLELSDRRAESVASILTEYFDIPPENLVTQGYGEEELKIPTDGPERANRRVAIRPIGSLLNAGR